MAAVSGLIDATAAADAGIPWDRLRTRVMTIEDATAIAAVSMLPVARSGWAPKDEPRWRRAAVNATSSQIPSGCHARSRICPFLVLQPAAAPRHKLMTVL